MLDTLHLLILDQSDNKLEALIRSLRDGGQAVYTESITGPEDLQYKLENKRWDLCCVTSDSASILDPAKLFSLIKTLNIDLPAIFLYDGDGGNAQSHTDIATQAFINQFVDAAPVAQIELVQHILTRELKSLEARRYNLIAESKLEESEQRCKLLLQGSEDGIAYIHEGMHIYANQKYISLFGYQSIDELEATPVMDLIGASSRDLFKRKLKGFGAGEQETIEFELCAQGNSGEEFNLPATLSPAQYDGEQCLQIILRPNEPSSVSTVPPASNSPASNNAQPKTALLNRREFINLTTEIIAQIDDTEYKPALSYLRIENATELVDSIGALGHDLLLEEVAHFISNQLEIGQFVTYFRDDTFAILSHSASKQALYTWAENLCDQLHGNRFDINQKSLHIECCLGITRISNPQDSLEITLSHAEQAAYTASGNDESSSGVFIHESDEGTTQSAALAKLDDFKDAMTHQALFLMYEPIIGLRGIGGELYELHTSILDSDGNELVGKPVQALAEEAGWLGKFDRWNILNGIKALAGHIARGHETALFIQVSHHSLCDESLIPWIGVALKAAAIPGNSVIFQITESDSASYLKQAKKFVDGVNAIGCRAAINQFGNSRDPLRTLQHLNADYVVMDPAFTADIETHQEKFSQLIGALQAEGKLIMVPGIDAPGVVSKLWQLGINYIQGPYLQEPSSQMDYEFDLEAG